MTAEAGREYYFLDEAGDTTLFNARGRLIIGQPGCSRFFLLGILVVGDPDSLTEQMESLRARLLADPYFQSVPSFDPRGQKTAVAFHATDDIAEVRREVFSLLRARDDLRFYAVIRDKAQVADYVSKRNLADPDYRYHPNELYDYLVRRLTKTLLHKQDEYHICFAKRGKKDRTQALRDALLKARQRFDQQWNKPTESQIYVSSRASKEVAGLQAVDYFLWALQRLLVRQEERYWLYVWPACKLIIDLDDQRERTYGAYFTQKKPLALAALDKRYFQD